MNSHSICLIVQARMSSKRFPGKVLYQIGNRPLIGHLFDRLDIVTYPCDKVLATSDHITDDKLATFCTSEGIACFRGDLDNVYKRFCDFLLQNQYEAFIRISGDSPLIDPALVDSIINRYLTGDYDLVSNVQKRSFPKGQSVEIVKTDCFLKTYPLLTTVGHYEHITSYFYEHRDHFNIFNMRASQNVAHVQMSVDTPGDLESLRHLILLPLEVKQNRQWQFLVKEL